MALINIVSYRHLYRARTVFYVLCVAVFALTPQGGKAQEAIPTLSLENPYVVEDIEVDITAANAVAARAEAFDAAQIQGFQTLAERILDPASLAVFEMPDINTVSSYVQNYEVTNEKLSTTRYKGVYKITYSDQAFAQTAEGFLNAESAIGGEYLVIPFFKMDGRDGNRTTLWSANPFYTAWMRARNMGKAGRAIVPIGDIEDLSQLKDEYGLRYDPSKLNATRLRYRADRVLVMQATPQYLSGNMINLNVEIYQAKGYGPELIEQILVRGYPGEMPEQFYNRVVKEVQQALQVKNQAQQITPVIDVNDVEEEPITGPVTTITAQYGFASVREWVKMKNTLESIRGVQSVQVQSLSPRQATLTLKFQGTIGSLSNDLSYTGLGVRNLGAATTVEENAIYQIYKLHGR